jgi:hypothetical protein
MKNIARFSESTECVVLDFTVACNQPKEDTTTPYFCNTSVIHQSLNCQHGSSLCIAVDVDEHMLGYMLNDSFWIGVATANKCSRQDPSLLDWSLCTRILEVTLEAPVGPYLNLHMEHLHKLLDTFETSRHTLFDLEQEKNSIRLQGGGSTLKEEPPVLCSKPNNTLPLIGCTRFTNIVAQSASKLEQ